MADAQAADTGPLSIDSAVAALGKEPDDTNTQPAGETAAETDQTAANPQADDVDAAPQEQVADEDVDFEPEAQPEEPALPAIDPPHSWDAESKRVFGELPRAAQETVARREYERDVAVSRAFQESAQHRQQADAEASRFHQHAVLLDQFIPVVAEEFKSRWSDFDFDKAVDEYGADQALKMQNAFNRDSQRIQQIIGTRQQAEQELVSRFQAREVQVLPQVAPDLVDPQYGSARTQAVFNYLGSSGIPQDRFKWITAVELKLAWKALQFDMLSQSGQSVAANPQKTQSAAPQQRQGVPFRPSASSQQRSNPARVADAAMTRLKQTGSIDDAVAALNARKKPSNGRTS